MGIRRKKDGEIHLAAFISALGKILPASPLTDEEKYRLQQIDQIIRTDGGYNGSIELAAEHLALKFKEDPTPLIKRYERLRGHWNKKIR
jgi:hypothetical protein